MTGVNAQTPPARTGPMVTQSRACPSCGYDLKGLFVGGNCPECGRTIGTGRSLSRSDLVDAPKSWLITLGAGLGLMSLSWVCLLLSIISDWRWSWTSNVAGASTIVSGAIVSLWLLGVFIVLRQRPADLRVRDGRRGDRPEWPRLRLVVALTQLAVIPALIFDYFRITSGAPIFGGLAIAFGLVVTMGYVPLCFWLGVVADWSNDETLGTRFRTLGGFLVAFGLGSSLTGGFLATGFPPLALLGVFWFRLFQLGFVLSIGVMLWSIVEMAWGVRWIMQNSGRLLERDEIRAAREAAEARRYAESDRLAAPAAPSPERAELLRTALEQAQPAPNAHHSQAPTSMPPGMIHANERVIPKTDAEAYRLEGE